MLFNELIIYQEFEDELDKIVEEMLVNTDKDKFQGWHKMLLVCKCFLKVICKMIGSWCHDVFQGGEILSYAFGGSFVLIYLDRKYFLFFINQNPNPTPPTQAPFGLHDTAAIVSLFVWTLCSIF